MNETFNVLMIQLSYVPWEEYPGSWTSVLSTSKGIFMPATSSVNYLKKNTHTHKHRHLLGRTQHRFYFIQVVPSLVCYMFWPFLVPSSGMSLQKSYKGR